MTRFLIGLTLAAFAVYGAWEAYPLLAGPSLVLTNPREGLTAPGGVVTIEGVAHRAATLTLDGGPILPDQSGRFAVILAFPRGGSILTLTATDRFGRSVTRERAIYVP